MTSLDLFAGAGGLTEGLRQVGVTCLYANEVVETYASAFAVNHPDAVTDTRDVREVDAGAVRKNLGLDRGALDLIVGGPPCQGFSINAPVRSSDDHRNHLFREYLRFVEEFEPKAVVIENVPGLVSFSGGGTLQAILQSLAELGYAADVRILYAPHFGVPQTRWRTVVLGFRGSHFPDGAFPDPTREAPFRVNFTSSFAGRDLVHLPHGPGLTRHTTVRDALDDLPVLENGEAGAPVKPYRTGPQNEYQAILRAGSSAVANHEAPRLSAINMERLRYIPAGGNWTDIPPDLLPRGMKRARRSDHTKRYGRVDPDGLSSTILTKCDPHWGAYFHYSQDRAFTVREAARIQSFPDTYVFTGSKAEQYAQVGNAVPPLMAAALGASVLDALGLGANERRQVA